MLRILKVVTFVACLAIIGIVVFVCGGVTNPPPAGDGSTRKDGGGVTPDCTVTMAKYNACQTGMSYGEVVKVIGCAGVEGARNEIGKIVTVVYTWQNPGGANMNATFQNGELVMKAQFGLK